MVFSFTDALIGLVPGLAWLWIFWRKDKVEPEDFPKLVGRI